MRSKRALSNTYNTSPGPHWFHSTVLLYSFARRPPSRICLGNTFRPLFAHLHLALFLPQSLRTLFQPRLHVMSDRYPIPDYQHHTVSFIQRNTFRSIIVEITVPHTLIFVWYGFVLYTGDHASCKEASVLTVQRVL
jgi:hypothetical protein